MQNYDIRGDLTDDRRTFLKTMLLVSAVIGIVLFGIRIYNDYKVFDVPMWVVLFTALVVSHLLVQRKSKFGAWTYVAGILIVFCLSLLQYGPSATIYLLFLGVITLAFLVLDRESVWTVAAFSLGLMFVLTLVQTGLLRAIQLTFMPLAFGLVEVGIYQIHIGNTLEMYHWASDIQQKASQRADMFFAQKEELADALLKLKHANSSLELLNVKLAEAQRKTEQASRAKSTFLSNMSHELRTPLNVIIGYTSTMLDMPAMYGEAPLPALYRSDVQLIKDNGYYLLTLINDILDLSKIEAGKLELHRSAVNLTESFRAILATSVGLVKDKPIQVRPDFPDDLPVVYADPVRVRQIILNLMSNAIKFTQSGNVTLHAHVENKRVIVSVIDTGIGIPETALNHIFDRFVQASADTDKHYGGTGLGLDISKQLALMHGGDLTVESQVGKGSTFSFSIAIAEQAAMEEAIPVPDRPVATALMPSEQYLASTILLVEDEASLREMMRRTLESVGHAVVEVQDGNQVLDLAEGLLPEAIILDIRLPNVDGWQLLASLKKNVDTASIPVIVSTVSEDEDRAMELGAALYLRKPFSSDELLTCVDSLLPQSLQPNRGV